jgi:hypothetical protein
MTKYQGDLELAIERAATALLILEILVWFFWMTAPRLEELAQLFH